MTGIINKKGKSAKLREEVKWLSKYQFVSIWNKYTYNKKYTCINKPVFVILSSLIMYAKLGSISGSDQAYLGRSHRYTQFLRLVFVCFACCCNKKCLIGSLGKASFRKVSFRKSTLQMIIASLLPETGGISGVTSKTKKLFGKKAFFLMLTYHYSQPHYGTSFFCC